LTNRPGAKLEVLLAGRQGALDSATASKQSATIRATALLPAEKASAEAALLMLPVKMLVMTGH
jgi:hypothetical protein